MPGNQCFLVIANRKPHLGPVCRIHIVRSAGATPLVATQPGSRALGRDARPVAGNREGQQHIVQLGVGELVALPGPALPGKILQAGVTALVKP